MPAFYEHVKFQSILHKRKHLVQTLPRDATGSFLENVNSGDTCELNDLSVINELSQCM